jgi:hypothetical protein
MNDNEKRLVIELSIKIFTVKLLPKKSFLSDKVQLNKMPDQKLFIIKFDSFE